MHKLLLFPLCIAGILVNPLFATEDTTPSLEINDNCQEMMNTENSPEPPAPQESAPLPTTPPVGQFQTPPEQTTFFFPEETAVFSIDQIYFLWKTKYLKTWTENGQTYARVIQMYTNNGTRTVSEGMGYGMLISAMCNDQITFDSLFRCVQKYCYAEGGNGLMPWAIDDNGVEDPASATDGDLDIAFALILASEYWPSNPVYRQTANAMIAAIKQYDTYIGSGGDSAFTWSGRMINPGSGWNQAGQNNFASSYFSPAHFQVFYTLTGDTSWLEVIENGWTALQGATQTHSGLMPDWFNQVTYGPAQNFPNDRNYAYDACRVPLRLIWWYVYCTPSRQQEIRNFIQKMLATFQAHPCSYTGGLTGGYDIFSGANLNDWDGQPQFNAPVATALALLQPDNFWFNDVLQPLNLAYLINMKDPGNWDSSPYYNTTLGLYCEILISTFLQMH